MNWKTWIPLVFAVVLALVAAKLTHDVIAGKKANAPTAAGDYVQVVVARGDLPPGAMLTSENMTLAPMPGKVAPAHTYTSTADLVDRVTAQPLVQGQPVNEQLLAPKGSGAGLQALVPPGMRAVTINVDEFTGLANLAMPNMNVDIVSTFRDDSSKDTVTRTVVQNLKILAVGPRLTAGGDDAKEAYKSVTLLATPKDAERVELATYTGRLRLVLRNGRDLAASPVKGVSLSELASGTSDTAAEAKSWIASLLAAAARHPSTQPVQTVMDTTPTAPVAVDPFDGPQTQQRQVEIIRGGVKSTVMFQVPRPSHRGESITDTTPALESATGK
jgi:pilus assembly protein CpaB